MDGKLPVDSHNPEKGASLAQVTTHFGSLETERVPMVIRLDNLPSEDEYEQVVDDFYKNLKSEHPYKYLDFIGEGGMGIVEMVKDKKCLRSIAKKTLNKAKFDQESIVRFTEEAQITAQLEHPNIVPVYEMGLDENNQLYYTMKMVKGRNLKEILNSIKSGNRDIIKKFPLSNLLEIYMAVCDAMSYACSRKIVHRDLKPDNIMVGDFGEVYLVDWGLSKIISNDSGKSVDVIPEWIIKEVYNKQDISTGKILKELRRVDSLRTRDLNLNISFNDILIGTPQYMAPERISGEADECSEVYALGAILYNILTLELTVSGDNLEEIVTKIFEEDIKNPLQFKNLPHLPGGKVPSGLAAVTMKALSAEPVNRYHTVTQLRNEISAWEDGYITEAEKAGPWLVLWSLIKRHRIETGISCLFFTAVILIYTFFAIKLKEDRSLAEEAQKNALNQKRVVESETAALLSKSRELEDKINELENLAPELYERSNFFIENNNLRRAQKSISDACRLNPGRELFVHLGNIQQSRGQFQNSIDSYKKAIKLEKKGLSMEILTDNKSIKDSINFSTEFLNKKMNGYLDLLRFRELLVRQNRFREAAGVSKKLYINSSNMKSDILERLAKAQLPFINERTLQVDIDGGFTLNMKNKGVSDLSPLAGIPFKHLDLSGNPVQNISPLKGMPLETLKINHTSVADIEDLRGAPLKYFEAEGTQIRSLTALSEAPIISINLKNSLVENLNGLTSPLIREAIFSNTPLSSLAGLNFRSLRVLDIDKTQITDLSLLQNSVLKALHMRKTNIEDISHLSKVFLTYLDLSDSPVKNFEVLKTAPLEKFIAERTSLKDLSFLKGKALTYFNAAGTPLENISILRNMPISYLNIDLTNIKDLSAISDMPLETFSYRGCTVKKFPPLNNLNEFSNIYLNSSRLDNYSFLKNGNFKEVNLSDSNIKSLDVLKDSTLKELNLNNTKISDLSPLKGKVIDRLIISRCPVNDLSPLAETQINTLDSSYIPAKDYSFLANTNLKVLYARRAQTESLNFINKQTIKELVLSDSLVSNLSPLQNSRIEILNLAYTKVRNVEALRNCSQLIELDLYRTEINSINALSRMKIESLILGECSKLQDLTPLKTMNKLQKLLIPKHIKNITFLQKRASISILGYTSAEHGQSARTFWEKYKAETADEQ